MIDPNEWSAAIDGIAAELLDQAGIREPPVDVLYMAAQLGMSVLIDRNQTTRARQKRLSGRASIFLRPDPRPERIQWAVAHEIGEHAAHRVFAQLCVPKDQVGSVGRERVANAMAARLLIPEAWFADDARQLDYDLLLLKGRYQTASHESIAWRLLDLRETGLMTVFDHNRLTWRRCCVSGRAPRLHPSERRCQAEVHHLGRSCTIESAALRIQGWPVHEPGWKREVLRTSAAFDMELGGDETACGEWDVAQFSDCEPQLYT